jgi:hypothetical protein
LNVLAAVPKFGIVGAQNCVMSKNTSVSLGEHFTTFVEEQFEHGRYGSASEAVRTLH